MPTLSVVIPVFNEEKTLLELVQRSARYRSRRKLILVRTGFAAASGDVTIVQDADLESDPA